PDGGDTQELRGPVTSPALWHLRPSAPECLLRLSAIHNQTRKTTSYQPGALRANSRCFARRLDPRDPLLQPQVLTLEHRLRQAIHRAIGAAVQRCEVALDAEPCFAAEHIRQPVRLALPAAREHLGAHAGR